MVKLQGLTTIHSHVKVIIIYAVSVRLMIIYRVSQGPRRNVPDFGRVFLMLKYTDITQDTYVQS
jgi:hypothetical protein